MKRIFVLILLAITTLVKAGNIYRPELKDVRRKHSA